MKFLVFILFFAELIHSSWEKDEFDYCEACRTKEEMRDTWLCSFCDDGLKENAVESRKDGASKPTAPAHYDYLHINQTVTSVNQNDKEERKETGRITWLYTKITISLILIVGSAFLCHYRHKRMKRLGLIVDHNQANVQPFAAVSYQPEPFYNTSLQNMYPPPSSPTSRYLQVEQPHFPLSRTEYSLLNFSKPATNAQYSALFVPPHSATAQYSPPEARFAMADAPYPSPSFPSISANVPCSPLDITIHPPPYTPYPQPESVNSFSQPLIVPSLSQNTRYPLLHRLHVPPPLAQASEEGQGLMQENLVPADPNPQQASDSSSKENEPGRNGEDKDNNPTSLKSGRT